MHTTAHHTVIESEPAANDPIATTQTATEEKKSAGVRVAQNTLAVLAGRGLGLVFAAAASVILARHLGVQGLGEYGAIYAYLSLFIWLGSAGLGPVMAREAARQRNQAGNIFFTGVCVCTGAVVATVAVALALSPFAHLGGRLFPLVLIGSIEVLLLIPVRLPGLIFQVDLRQWYGSVFGVLRQGLWFGMVLALYWAGASLFHVVLGRLAVGMVEAALHWRVGNRFLAPPRQFLTPVARKLLRGGAVIALTALASNVYLRIDQVMLHSMVDDRVLGIYVAAVRISELFEALPAALGATMFPLLCAAADDRATFDRYLDITYRILIVAAAAICVAITVSAPALVTLLYGSEFEASATLLMFLIWSEIAVFFSAVVYNALVAMGLERHLILATLMGAGMNVGLNAVLIPKWGAMGSVWATIAGYSVAWMAALLPFARTRPIIWRGLRVTLPATALACFVALGVTRLPVNDWFRVLLALVLFGAGAVLLRLVRRSDAEYAGGILAKVWAAVGDPAASRKLGPK